jgi:cytochrome c553
MSSATSAVRATLYSRTLRWIVVGLATVVVTALAVLYGGSSLRMARTYDASIPALRLSEPGSVERGERLAGVYACKDCHGTHGRIFFDVPMVGRLIAPDLARTAPKYTDAELVGLLRHGIKRDRTSAIIMPADALSSLADADVADIIAWLRALKPESETETAETTVGPLARLGMISGGFPFSTDMQHDPSPPATRPTGDQLALGEYLTKTACNHCHRMDEDHVVKPGLTAPPVRPMGQSYDAGQFKDLLRTGKALGDRKLELMSDVARSSFSHLTDEEIAAIHAYLNAPVAEPAK